MSDYGDGARASFEPHHGRDPKGRHLVLKPGRKRSADGSRAGPSDLSTLRLGRNAYKHYQSDGYCLVSRVLKKLQNMRQDADNGSPGGAGRHQSQRLRDPSPEPLVGLLFVVRLDAGVVVLVGEVSVKAEDTLGEPMPVGGWR
jgi:hypothetical protein